MSTVLIVRKCYDSEPAGPAALISVADTAKGAAKRVGDHLGAEALLSWERVLWWVAEGLLINDQQAVT